MDWLFFNLQNSFSLKSDITLIYELSLCSFRSLNHRWCWNLRSNWCVLPILMLFCLCYINALSIISGLLYFVKKNCPFFIVASPPLYSSFATMLQVRLRINSGDGYANHHPKGKIVIWAGPFNKKCCACWLLKRQNRKNIENACRKWQIMMMSPMCIFQTKKVINNEASIQIKFELHHYLSYDKIFKTRPHLPIFT